MGRVKKLGVLALFIFSQYVQAQILQETRVLDDFTSVKIANSIEAELVKGDKNQIKIIAAGIELDKVETNVDDHTLEVKLLRGNFKSYEVKVFITYVNVDEIQAFTNAKVYVKDLLEMDQVYLYAVTNAFIEAEVNSQTLHIEAFTNAKISVSGSSEDLNIRIFSNSEVNGKYLQVKNAEILANTAAKAELWITESIKGNASTAGRVLYIGDPGFIEINTHTGGSIRKNE